MVGQKRTLKKERFAQAYVEFGNGSKAYRQAYNAENMKLETIHKRASELLCSGVVKGLIEELQAAHRQSHDVTVQSLCNELDKAYKLALENNQSGPAVAAVMGKAKLHGLLVDRQEVKNVDKASDMTDAELEAIIRADNNVAPLKRD